MATSPSLLTSLHQIDADWLEAVLAEAGHPNARIDSFALAPIGAGNVGDTARIDMVVSGDPEAPRAMVCKFSAANESAHAHGIGSGSYGREVESYRAFARSGSVCRMPALYWVAGGSEGINLALEDLTRTTRPGDQIAGCSVAEAASVIDELARLHRHSFPMPRDQVPDWALTMADGADYWSSAIARALPIVRANDHGRLDRSEWALIEQANAKASSWYCLPVARGTLTHGDPRVDNILFQDEPTPSAVILDWQMTGWRNPMHDVGYFLSGSVSVEDRRAHDRALLARYLQTFGPDRGYALAEIEADYRVQLLSGLMTTLAAYSVLPITPHVDQLLITLLKRNLAAAADWASLDAF